MKKMKLLAVAAIVVAAVGTGAYVSVERSNGAIASDVVLANVEALADSESGSGSYECCNTCKGTECGTFTPVGSSTSITVYYK